MNYQKKLIVEPGSKLRYGDLDSDYHGKYQSEAEAKAETEETLTALTALQRLLYGERRHALLIVLQGTDAAGKDGVCWHIIRAMNPQGTSVVGFKQPTVEELAHDFLWRVHPHAPGHGRVAVWNRSHYEDVLVARVHNLVPKSAWEKRYEQINAFEKLLHTSGTTILKFFLHISKEEQLKRFKARLDDPARNWKISQDDYAERAFWSEYASAYEDMLVACSTSHAPWYAIPSNHKWFRNLAVSQILRATMDALGMKLPEPTVDLAKIRQEYHAALEAEKDAEAHKPAA
ncbi:UDP-galactose-lipid carrier transferase [Minicystis rosea]|nr:UDP-galactose-lipid carrier transferase [Minicystis rosea]